MDRIFVFLAGLALGSAVNVIAGRFGQQPSFFSGRSSCDHCGRPLRAWQLIPVVGFLVQKGRCHFCGKLIPLKYSLVELAMALIALLLYQGFTASYLLALLLAATLLAVSLVDFDRLIIPDSFLAIAAALAVATIVLGGGEPRPHLIGATAGLFLPGILVLPSRGKLMGFGDVKLGGVVGLWLGFPAVLTAFWLAFVLGGIVSLFLLSSGRKRAGDQIAFGPFLVLGSLVAYRFSTILLSYVWF